MESSGVRDVTVTLAARIGVVVLGIGLQSSLAWFLGPVDRGAYAVAVVYSSLLSVVFALGLDGATQYFLASDRATTERGVSALLLLEGALSVVGVVAGLAALELPLAFFDKAGPMAFLIAVITFPTEMVSNALLLLLGSRRQFEFQAVLMVVRMALRLGLVFALVWGLERGVEGALIANLAAFVLSSCFNLTFLRRRGEFRWVWPDLALLRGLLGYGGRYYVAAFSTLVNAQIGVILVAFIASAELVGLFSTAVALVAYVLMLSDVVGAAIHPRIAADPSGRPELAAQAVRVVGVLSALVLIAMASVASPMVELLLSPSFLPVVPVIRILALGVAFRAGTKVLIHYFNAMDRPGVFSMATVIGTTANFLLLLLLLPNFGLEGAAWAMTLSYLINGSFLLVAFRLQSGLGVLESWLPRREDLDFALASYYALRRRISSG